MLQLLNETKDSFKILYMFKKTINLKVNRKKGEEQDWGLGEKKKASGNCYNGIR